MRASRLIFAVPSLLATRRSSALMTTAAAANAVTLNDGRKHPLVGYGTYKVGFVPTSASSAVAETTAADAVKASKVEVSAAECVEMALNVGYRFLDCAEFYGNEAEVGKAIAKSGVPRADLFLASKCAKPLGSACATAWPRTDSACPPCRVRGAKGAGRRPSTTAPTRCRRSRRDVER